MVDRQQKRTNDKRYANSRIATLPLRERQLNLFNLAHFLCSGAFVEEILALVINQSYLGSSIAHYKDSGF